MLKNSVKENVAFFIDSSTRNRLYYPYPSEFVVVLEEPIRNLYGVDILDASIPNTQYNIDVSCNHIRFIMLDSEKSKAILQAREGLATDEEYDKADVNTLQSAFFILGWTTPVRAWKADDIRCTINVLVAYQEDWPFPNFPIGLQFTSQDSKSEVGQEIENTYYYFLLRLKFNDFPIPLFPIADSEAANHDSELVLQFNSAYYISNSVPLDAASNVSGNDIIRETNLRLIREGRGVVVFPSAQSGYYDIYSYKQAEISANVYQSIIGTYPNIKLAFSYVSAEVGVGQYSSLSAVKVGVQSALNKANIPVNIEQYSKSTGVQSRFTLTSADRFIMCRTSLRTIIGFDILPESHMNRITFSKREQDAVLFGNEQAPDYASVVQSALSAKSNASSISSPGVATLLGERYIKLRIPELEQYMPGVGKIGQFSTGIGVFKLVGIDSVAQLRFDYVSLQKKPIHPIARVSRLTFRFETVDGSLYDFKGINTQLLINLKYYAPVPMEGQDNLINMKSVLNPDYNPDMLDYVARSTAFAKEMEDGEFVKEEDQTSSEPESDDDTDSDDDSDDNDAGNDDNHPSGSVGFQTLQELSDNFIKFDSRAQNSIKAIEDMIS